MNGEIYLEALVATLKEAGDRTVLEHDGVATTAADLLAVDLPLCPRPRRPRIGRGDLVALLAPNSPDALAVRYATHLVGAAAMYLPCRLPEAQQRAALARVRSRRTCWSRSPRPRTCSRSRATVRVAVVGCDVPGAPLRLDRRGVRGVATRCPAGPGPTTSPWSSPQAAPPASRRAAWRDFATYTAMVSAPSAADRRQLANGHLAYLTQLLVDMTLLGGGTVVLQDAVEPAATLATIEPSAHHRPVPRRAAAVRADGPPRRRAARPVVAAGARRTSARRRPPTLRRRARARLGAVIAHTYGASEMGIVSALPPAEHDRPTRAVHLRRPHPPRRRGPVPPRTTARSAGAGGAGRDRGPLARDGRRATATGPPSRPRPSSTAGTAPATSAPGRRGLPAHPRPGR